MWLTALELKYIFKKLTSQISSSLIIIVSLAFGVATNTSIFGWVDSFVLNALPAVENVEQLHSITTKVGEDDYIDSSFKDFSDMRASGQLLSSTMAFKYWPVSINRNNVIKPIVASLISANFFDVLAIKAQKGRFIQPSDHAEQSGGKAIVVISDRFWRQELNTAADVIGKTLVLNSKIYTIIGVAPVGFIGAEAHSPRDLWLPVAEITKFTGTNKWFEERQTRPFKIMTRLADNTQLEEAQAQGDVVMERLSGAFPDTNRNIGLKVYPFMDSPEGGQTEITMLIYLLYIASFVILAIIFSNLLNISFVQSIAREKEISIRRFLGAQINRIVSMLVIEGFILSFIAAVISMGLVVLFYAVLSSWDIATPTSESTTLSLELIIYCFSLTFVCGLLISIAPAIRLNSLNLASSLQESMRGTTAGKKAKLLRSGLITFQVVLAFLALVTAGSFTQSLNKIESIERGFQIDNTTLYNLSVATTIENISTLTHFVENSASAISSLPDVNAVAYADFVPLGGSGGSWEAINIEGYNFAPNENNKLFRNFVSDNYFDVMGIDLVDGRAFGLADEQSQASVAIVNQAFAQQYFFGRPAIGRVIQGWGQNITIVGVVKNSKIKQLTETVGPYFYLPFRQFASNDSSAILHVASKSGAIIDSELIRATIKKQGSLMYISWSASLTEFVQTSISGIQLTSNLLTLLGGGALFLSAIGIYGVVSRSISQRTQEIGVRVAVGASPFSIVWLILRQTMGVIFVGGAIGIFLFSLLWQDIANVLYESDGIDVMLMVVTMFCISLVALLASLFPSLKASRIDPVDALAIH